MGMLDKFIILVRMLRLLWVVEHALQLHGQHVVTLAQTIFQATYDLGERLLHVSEHLYLSELRDLKILQDLLTMQLAYLNFLVFFAHHV